MSPDLLQESSFYGIPLNPEKASSKISFFPTVFHLPKLTLLDKEILWRWRLIQGRYKQSCTLVNNKKHRGETYFKRPMHDTGIALCSATLCHLITSVTAEILLHSLRTSPQDQNAAQDLFYQQLIAKTKNYSLVSSANRNAISVLTSVAIFLQYTVLFFRFCVQSIILLCPTGGFRSVLKKSLMHTVQKSIMAQYEDSHLILHSLFGQNSSCSALKLVFVIKTPLRCLYTKETIHD